MPRSTKRGRLKDLSEVFEMVKFQELKESQLSQVLGGTHRKRGGGRYHCRVDWSRSWYCIVNRAGGAYATGGQATIGNC